MTDTPVKPFLCGKCGYAMDMVTPAFDDKAKPAKGDIGICLSCGAVFEYQTVNDVRYLSHPEIAALPFSIRWQLERAEVARRRVVPSGGLADRGMKQ